MQAETQAVYEKVRDKHHGRLSVHADPAADFVCAVSVLSDNIPAYVDSVYSVYEPLATRDPFGFADGMNQLEYPDPVSWD